MESAHPHTTSYVALLRGINVGGANIVSMAALKASFEELGLANVRTYINSGNVLFQSDSADSHGLESAIEPAIALHFAKPIRVMVRSAQDMKAVMAHLPKSWQDTSDKKCNVIFLSHAIDEPGLVEKIVERFQPKPDLEEVHYAPGVLFWSSQLNGLTKSTMIKLSSSPMYQEMTIRGLNTTRKLCGLLQA